MATISLRRDRLNDFRQLKGEGLEVDAAFAERIGVNPGQVSRVLRGISAPGTRFIAGCLELFGTKFFADLFTVEPDEDAA